MNPAEHKPTVDVEALSAVLAEHGPAIHPNRCLCGAVINDESQYRLHVALCLVPVVASHVIAERARVVARVREHCCTCHTADYAAADAHEDWCPAAAVDDELLDLEDPR